MPSSGRPARPSPSRAATSAHGGAVGEALLAAPSIGGVAGVAPGRTSGSSRSCADGRRRRPAPRPGLAPRRVAGQRHARAARAGAASGRPRNHRASAAQHVRGDARVVAVRPRRRVGSCSPSSSGQPALGVGERPGRTRPGAGGCTPGARGSRSGAPAPAGPAGRASSSARMRLGARVLAPHLVDRGQPVAAPGQLLGPPEAARPAPRARRRRPRLGAVRDPPLRRDQGRPEHGLERRARPRRAPAPAGRRGRGSARARRARSIASRGRLARQPPRPAATRRCATARSSSPARRRSASPAPRAISPSRRPACASSRRAARPRVQPRAPAGREVLVEDLPAQVVGEAVAAGDRAVGPRLAAAAGQERPGPRQPLAAPPRPPPRAGRARRPRARPRTRPPRRSRTPAGHGRGGRRRGCAGG